MTFSLSIEALNVEDDFFLLFDTIDICYRWVVGATLFLPAMMPKIFLVILVFFTGLILVGKRLLRVFSIRYVSIGRVSVFIFPEIFVLFFG